MIFKNQKEKKDARRHETCADHHHAYMFRQLGTKVEFECMKCGNKVTVDA